VQQEDDSIDIRIDPAPEEHRRTYPQASLHLAEEEVSATDGAQMDTDGEATGEMPVPLIVPHIVSDHDGD
jgi:hypothetical protein